MHFYESESNVAAHGMSSAEEAKYRYWEADPEYLRDPFDVAADAAARRERLQADMHTVGLQVGSVSMLGAKMVRE